MRILHLTPELPYWPGGSGGSTRQFHLLRRLRELGHAVTVVAPVHPAQRAGAARLREAGIGLVSVERPASRAWEALGAIARRPELVPALAREPLLAWQVDVFWTRLRAAAAAAHARERPDVVLVEHDWAADWHRHLPPGIPRVLTLQNLSWSYYEARARSAAALHRVPLALEARRFARWDRRHLGAYDLLVAMSEVDRASVRTVTGTPCEVVPNGVDVDQVRPEPAAGRPAPLLLYTGTMSYPPNAEGLRWLLGSVWPLVHRAVPAAELRVVGRGVDADVAEALPDGVELAGWVESMAPHFAEATLILVPILSGGGTRLKVLDGLASGRPVVSTRAGAEGIDVLDERDVLLADRPQDFADAIVRVLEDAALARRLGAAGRRLAEERYDWRALGDRLEALLLDVVDRGRPSAGPSSAAS